MKSPPGQQHLLAVRQQTENPRHDQNVEWNVMSLMSAMISNY